MSKEQKITGNIKPPNTNLEILRQNFPNCFDKSGNLDFEKLKKQLSKNEINFSKESYGMDWLGKSYARLLATDETTTLLKEDEKFNQKDENKNSENLLIKGDNLEVLKHLSNAYYEKIKMIYIDPPYNTGSDGFVYADDRKFDVPTLMELSGVSEERAKRILDFTQSKSNSHSAWLTFMYPRLYIAKQLLRDDGVIFVSIDDNEIAQLKLLLDEIFGEENFVSDIVVVNNLKGRNDKKYIATAHERLLMYVKSDIYEENGLKLPKKRLKEFKKKDNIGLYRNLGLRKRGGADTRKQRPKMFFPIYINENTNEVSLKKDEEFQIELYPRKSDASDGCWRWGFDTVGKRLKSLEGLPVNNKIGWDVFEKDYLETNGEIRRIKPKSVMLGSNYSTDGATKSFRELMGSAVFNSPKSINFLRDLIFYATFSSSNDLILDFFAGSGTTADAVMQLNAEDGGNRKFILAQLPELIDPKSNKTAYDFVKDKLNIEPPTIFEITKERLIRASKKIQEENKDKDLSNQDLGFKVFETMPIWEDYNFESEELEKQTSLFDESKLTKEDIKALLVTWKTYDGISLTETIQKTDLNGYTAHYCNEKLYLMDDRFKTDNLKALLEKIDSDKDFNPTTIIAFGYHFESKSLREISENIKSYANKKSIDIDFITRY